MIYSGNKTPNVHEGDFSDVHVCNQPPADPGDSSHVFTRVFSALLRLIKSSLIFSQKVETLQKLKSLFPTSPPPPRSYLSCSSLPLLLPLMLLWLLLFMFLPHVTRQPCSSRLVLRVFTFLSWNRILQMSRKRPELDGRHLGSDVSPPEVGEETGKTSAWGLNLDTRGTRSDSSI